MRPGVTIFLMISTVWMLASCTSDERPDLSEVVVELKFSRFERSLASLNGMIDSTGVEQLRQEYGGFVDVFTRNIMSMPGENDSAIAVQLSHFLSDSAVAEVFELVDERYGDTGSIESDLEEFFRHFCYYFPKGKIPHVVTYVSAFNYGVVMSDSTMGIGLDMFLGPDEPIYPMIGIPQYLFRKFSEPFIIPNCIRVMYQDQYDPLLVKNELLSQMIYEGKQLYYINRMAPSLHDTLVTGFTGAQLDWCRKNEADVWGFFIENKLLFNTDPSEYVKYVKDGPTTSGFPEGSPGNVGSYTGWMIVQEFARENPDIPLAELMELHDAQMILQSSGYKPNK